MTKQQAAILRFALNEVKAAPNGLRLYLWLLADALFDKLSNRPQVYRNWK